jgi:hypothetical protein
MPAPMPVCAALCVNRASFSDFHDNGVCTAVGPGPLGLASRCVPGRFARRTRPGVYRWTSGVGAILSRALLAFLRDCVPAPLKASGVRRGICIRFLGRVAGKEGLTPGRRFRTLPHEDLLGRFPPPYRRLLHGVIALQIEPDSRASAAPRHGWLAVCYRALCGGPGQIWPFAGAAAVAE